MAKPRRWRDPFADYIEWSNNRYNPGHYLGGNAPPHLRHSSLGMKGRRLAGILLAGMAALMIGSVLPTGRFPREVDLLYAVLAAPSVSLLIAAATAMLRSSRRDAPRPERRGRRKR